MRIQRREIIKLLDENLSLKSYLEAALLEAYENSRDLASGETNLALATFPQICLYSWEEIISNSFYPSTAASDNLMG